jgi:hypothetical protein
VKILAIIAALLIAAAAGAAEPPAAAKPEEKPEAQNFVVMPEWIWLQAVDVMRAQQVEIGRLRAEAAKRNTCREGI